LQTKIEVLLFTASLASFAVVSESNAATDYNFSYTFENGYNVSGVVEGTTDIQNADVIDVSSILWMSFDGTVVSGPIIASQLGGPVPQISANLNLNAFHFSNLNDPNWAFYNQRVFNSQDGTFEYEEGWAVYNDGSSYTILGDDKGMSQASWSFAPVPEPSSCSMAAGALLCLGAASSEIKKRRLRQAITHTPSPHGLKPGIDRTIAIPGETAIPMLQAGSEFSV
jgi:hypothetical protein